MFHIASERLLRDAKIERTETPSERRRLISEILILATQHLSVVFPRHFKSGSSFGHVPVKGIKPRIFGNCTSPARFVMPMQCINCQAVHSCDVWTALRIKCIRTLEHWNRCRSLRCETNNFPSCERTKTTGKFWAIGSLFVP